MADSTTSLAQPLYGAGWGQAITRFFRKYATFSGRASRSEYWWWVLTNALVGVAFDVLGRFFDGDAGVAMWPLPYLTGALPAMATPATTVWSALAVAYALVTLLPSLALLWRRLHDTGRSGGWFFIVFVPLVGPIVLLVFTIGGPRPEGYRFDDPV
ncbi:DUF805 domain-containing protein [Microbacterium sp. NPDC089189]|uniref:DUF805 domain-containing protein n=1 Tax=Microbacterium sp. NPDC089189 TaxID=3154972 RepID=UPI0034314F52